jgi:hypothetical protein
MVVRGMQPPQARGNKPHNGKRISRGDGKCEGEVCYARRFVVVDSSCRQLWGVGMLTACKTAICLYQVYTALDSR